MISETGTDSTNNPGTHSADVPTVHDMAFATQPCSVMATGDFGNVSHQKATKFKATALHRLPQTDKIKLHHTANNRNSVGTFLTIMDISPL